MLALLRMGATPERLAWSLAVGVVVGVNPLLGSTTLLALGVAAAFRLNLAASQLGNHVMYPVELAMFPVFVKLGSVVFRTARLPWGREELWAAARTHPWATTRCCGCGSGTRWWCGRRLPRWRCRRSRLG